MPCNLILFHNYTYYLSQCQVTKYGDWDFVPSLLGLCPKLINLICLGLCPIMSVRLSYIYGTGVVQRHPLLHTYAGGFLFTLFLYTSLFLFVIIIIIVVVTIICIIGLIKLCLRLSILEIFSLACFGSIPLHSDNQKDAPPYFVHGASFLCPA